MGAAPVVPRSSSPSQTTRSSRHLPGHGRVEVDGVGEFLLARVGGLRTREHALHQCFHLLAVHRAAGLELEVPNEKRNPLLRHEFLALGLRSLVVHERAHLGLVHLLHDVRDFGSDVFRLEVGAHEGHADVLLLRQVVFHVGLVLIER